MPQYYTKEQIDEIAFIIGTEIHSNKRVASKDNSSFILALEGAMVDKTTPVNLSSLTNFNSPGNWDAKIKEEDLKSELLEEIVHEKLMEVLEIINLHSSVNITSNDIEAYILENNSIEIYPRVVTEEILFEIDRLKGDPSGGVSIQSETKLTGRLILIFNQEKYTKITTEYDLSTFTNRDMIGTWDVKAYGPEGVYNYDSDVLEPLIDSMRDQGLVLDYHNLQLKLDPNNTEVPPGYTTRIAVPKSPSPTYRYVGEILLYIKLLDFRVYNLKNLNILYKNNYISLENEQLLLVEELSTKPIEESAVEIVTAIVDSLQYYSDYSVTEEDLETSIEGDTIVITPSKTKEDPTVSGKVTVVFDRIVLKDPIINLSTVTNNGIPGQWEIPYPRLVDVNYDPEVVFLNTMADIVASLGLEPIHFELNKKGRSVEFYWNTLRVYHNRLRGDEDIIGNLAINFVGAERAPLAVNLGTLTNINIPGVWFTDKELKSIVTPAEKLLFLKSIFESTSWVPTLEDTRLDISGNYFTISEVYSDTKPPGSLEGTLTGYHRVKVNGEFKPVTGRFDLNTLGWNFTLALPNPSEATKEQILNALVVKINELTDDPITADQLECYIYSQENIIVTAARGITDNIGITNQANIALISD